MSVIVPVYGEAHFLEEAVSSVIGQEYRNWEMILVLDRPTNEQKERANKFQQIDSRIQIIESPGSGIVDALNEGLSWATSELIARVDSDDVMEPERLKTQVERMMRENDLICLGSQMQLIDVEGRPQGVTNYPISMNDIQRHLRYQNCIGHPSVIFRKSKVLELGGYRKILTGVEDYDLWLRLIRDGKIKNEPRFLTKYRVSKGQYSKSFGSTYTHLENLARLDLEFDILGHSPIENLKDEEIRKIFWSTCFRKSLSHPIKVRRCIGGHATSKLIRIAGQDESKFVKSQKLVPWTIVLLFTNSRGLLELLRFKLKSLREKKN